MTQSNRKPASGYQPFAASEAAPVVAVAPPCRRQALRGILAGATVGGITALPVAAASSVDHPDQALCEMGEQLEVMHREWIAISQSYRPAMEEAFEKFTRLGELTGDYGEAMRPFNDVSASADALDERITELATVIMQTPAVSLAGLAVKARAVEIASHGWHFGQNVGGVRELIDRREIDWDKEQLLILTDEIRRLAAIETAGTA